MDDSYLANLTLIKLVEASKRGVKVVLLVDDVNIKLNQSLQRELEQAGGIIHPLNNIQNYIMNLNFSRDVFRRHHEKVAIIDSTGFIGSANIADSYGGYIYGENDFYDLNTVMKNVCLSQIRKAICDTVGFYGLRLDHTLSNEEILNKYNELYQDSLFSTGNTYLIRSIPPKVQEIQKFLIDQISNAKKSIRIIQPYYYKIPAFENAIIGALDRGVHVEIVTAHKRDQPVYSSLKNMLLMGNMISKGLKVYEFHDRLLHMKTYLFDDELYTLGKCFF